MRRILQSMGAEVIHLGHNRSVDEVVTAALQEDVQGIAISSLPGRARRVLQVHDRPAARARRREHPGLRRRRRRHRRRPRSRSCTTTASRASSRPRTGSGSGLQGMIGEMVAECDVDLSPLAPTSLDALKDNDQTKRWRALARADHRAGARRSRRQVPRVAAQGGRHREGADARHHRHRRRRQVEPDRRAGPPHPPRPGRRAADRGDLDRSVAPQERRRAARRPHPHERDQSVGGRARRSTCARWRRAKPAARSRRRCPT